MFLHVTLIINMLPSLVFSLILNTATITLCSCITCLINHFTCLIIENSCLIINKIVLRYSHINFVEKNNNKKSPKRIANISLQKRAVSIVILTDVSVSLRVLYFFLCTEH